MEKTKDLKTDNQSLLTLVEVTSLTKLGYITLLRLIRSGKLRAFKVGNAWRVSEEELRSFVKKQLARH